MFLILSVNLLILSACVDTNEITGKTQSLEQFYKDAKIDNVDKIFIRDGSTGASKTVTNQEQINEFLSLINEIEYTPQENQEKRKGWTYEITLYDDDNQFLFYLNNIQGVFYDSNPNIYPIVDAFYKQLDFVKE